jgi:hypothetical protein
MFAKKLALAALLVATATGFAGAADLPVKAAKVAPPPPPFFFVNDNFLSYHYEFTATNPGAGTTPKNVASFTHFDVWAYGTNFINIDWLKATSHNTPAAPCVAPATTACAPYTEIYGFARSTFGWNEIFNTKMFSFGPLTDISFMVGADGNVDNTALESAKKSIEGGLTFSFAAPYHGFLNLSPNAYKEWQNDGFNANTIVNPSGNVSFNTVAALEWLYVQPLGFLPPSIPLTFKAFGTVHGAKGCGELCATPATPFVGGPPRAVEVFSQENLELDWGKMLLNKPGMYSAWVGYRYWYNKFGIDHTQIPVPAALFSIESTWLVGTSVAF